MSNPKRRVRRNALATSVSVALLGAIVAPATATDPRSALASSTTTTSPNVRLPDLGRDIPRSRDPEAEALEALKWVAQAGSGDAILDGAIDRGLSAGLDAARDTHLPFLGNLQGAVRWNDATNAFDFDLLSIYALKGTGEGHNWLVQLGGHNIANRFTINSGLVYRWVDLESQWLLGGNVFLDHDIDGGVSRVGVGAEAATPSLRAFANVYAPLGGWKVSPDDTLLEERAARGYDLGLAWTPRAFDIFDLQAKGSRWYGDAVDVFGNGQTQRDPTVWSVKASLQPVPAFGISAEHRMVEGGDTDSIVALTYTYRFGEDAAQQFVAAPKGQRNDLRQRALLPVEREKRIVTESRDRYAAPTFASDRATLSVDEGEALSHALLVAGGAGALRYTLWGPDAALFSLSGTTLTLPAQDADAPADSGANGIYDVFVTVTDERGRTASQAVSVEVRGVTPVPRNAAVSGAIGAPQVGQTLGVQYAFHSPIGEVEDAAGLQLQWFRQAPTRQGAQVEALAILGTGPQYVVTQDDVGHHVGVRIVVRSVGGRTNVARPVVALSDIVVGAALGAAPTATATLSGDLVVGQTLTGAYTFNDADGDAEGASTLQWYRQDDAAGSGRVAIAGANALHYTLTPADEGKFVAFQVIPVSATGEPATGVPATATSASAVDPLDGTPSYASVTVQGTHNVGETLTAIPEGFADADGDLPGTPLYQWFMSTNAAGTNRLKIAGATQSTYVVEARDQSHFLHVEVTPVSLSGTPLQGLPVLGGGTEVAGRAPTATPTITGEPTIGATLTGTVNYADADGDQESVSLTQWYRATNATDRTTWVAIEGAAGKQRTYTVVAEDAGHFLVFDVLPRASYGNPHTGEWTSIATSSTAQSAGTPPRMGKPRIDGVPASGLIAGTVLTAVPQGYQDAEQDAEGTHRYQWYRATDANGTNVTAIADANSPTYTVVAGDLDRFLVVDVTPVSATGLPDVGVPARGITTSAVVGSPPTIDSVTFTGTLLVGETLNGEVNGFNDVDGDQAGTHLYQWFRATDAQGNNRTAIPGATTVDYVIQAADANHYLVLQVKPMSASGTPVNGMPVFGTTGRINAAVGTPPWMDTPRIDGVPSLKLPVGTTLTAVPQGYADHEQDPEGEHLFQWYRTTEHNFNNATVIEGANAATYTVQAADAGFHIGVGVRPVSASGLPSTGLEYRRVTDVKAYIHNDAPTLASVRVDGDAIVGGTVHAVAEGYSDTEGDEADTHTYAWFTASNAAGTEGKSYIIGANQETFTVRAQDAGLYLFAQVKPRAQTGELSGSPVVGAAGLVAAEAGTPPTIGTPTITGEAKAGSTLTAVVNDYADADQDAAGEHQYAWLRRKGAAGFSVIAGETSSTYVVRDADRGYEIAVEVTPVSQTGVPNTGVKQTSSVVEVEGTAPVANPTISGNAVVGETLTATLGYSDAEGDAESGSEFYWFAKHPSGARDALGTPGSLQYTITADRVGYEIGFSVRPKSATGTPSTGELKEVLTGVVTAEATQIYANENDFAIPDHVGATNGVVESPIVVSGRAGNASSTTKIIYDIKHPYSSDLEVEIVSPSGATRMVRPRPPGATGPNLAGTVELDLSNDPMNGTWKLRVTDTGPLDVGYLDRWSIEF